MLARLPLVVRGLLKNTCQSLTSKPSWPVSSCGGLRTVESFRSLSSDAHTLLPTNILATYYRGGTSRAVMFNKGDLPRNETLWPHVFRRVIGSPDLYGRQLNGMGGGISSLSKICIVGQSSHPSADVDYTFVQIGVKDDTIDLSSMCGNMAAAVGPFALDSQLVKPNANAETTVRIFNTNTSKILHSTFAIEGGILNPQGDFSIDGVAGTATPIALNFINPAGSKTGKLLPTGNDVDRILDTDVSCIDCGNPCVFVRAQDMGINGSILPDGIDMNLELLSRLENIRQAAAVVMGMSQTEEKVPLAIPKIIMVSPPHKHKLTSGEELMPQDCDLVARTMSSKQPHKAIPVTVSMAVAAAADLPGTIVAKTVGKRRSVSDNIIIAHASGRMVVGASWRDEGAVRTLTSALVMSTARKLMRGVVFV